MPTDLPDPIRAALHSDEIDAADLHRPTLSDRTGRHGRAPRFRVAAAIVAVAAAVVAVAVIASVAGSGNDGQRPVLGADPLAGVVGYRWTVAGVHDARGAISVPASVGGQIGYTSGGQVLGDGSVNAVSGRYEPEPGGYQVHDASSTLAGYAGTDQVRVRTIDAVDGMFIAVTDTAETAAPAVHVAVHLAGTTLTLSRDGTTLTLTRAGVQPDQPTSTPSATASLTAAPDKATIRGRLLLVGGPAPGTPRPIAGSVVVREGASVVAVIAVEKDGRYSAVLAPGIYRIAGNYNQTRSTSAQTDECHSTATTTVLSAGRTTQVDVNCNVP